MQERLHHPGFFGNQYRYQEKKRPPLLFLLDPREQVEI